MNRITAIFVTLSAAVVLAASVASAAAPSAFKLTTTQGRKGTFTFTSYEFLKTNGTSVTKPAKSGSLMVDVQITSGSEKQLFKKGKLKAASLHVSATLPKPQNFTYTLGKPKITSVDFVHGSLGEVGAVSIAYTSIRKS